jgi:hypothetical protein
VSLLQNPCRALDQIDWYLENQELEQFPGAFLLAAGNLARQVLEQVVFILAFYSGLPHTKYMRPDRRLRTAGEILRALNQPRDSASDYFAIARSRSSRTRKFAVLRRRLPAWLRQLNEPSHYRNPAARRRFREADIAAFTDVMRRTFAENDTYLILAAVNEIISGETVKAELGPEPECTPATVVTSVVRPRHIRKENGKLVLRVPCHRLHVLPADAEVDLRRSNAALVIQHTSGLDWRARFVDSAGRPVNITSIRATIASLAATPQTREQIVRRLRRLGYRVSFQQASSEVNTSSDAARTQ